MAENLLRNASFEQGIPEGNAAHVCLVITPDPHAAQPFYMSQRGEINNPVGWVSWFVHDVERPPAHDPSNTNGWCEPETRPAPHAGRYYDGANGHLMFTFYRIHDGGYYQQVSTAAGKRLRASVFAHAWSSNTDNPKHSEGVGEAAFFALEGETDHKQVTFWVGVDPTGGTDPMAPSVVWGRGAHIYNVYHEVPAVEVVAKAETVTVFTRQRFLWPFKHCDGYVDAAALTVVDKPSPEPEPEPPDQGPVDYDYPVIERGSKLTAHAIGESGAYDLVRYLAEQGTPLPFLKVVAAQAPKDLLAVRNLKALSPTTRIIGRVIMAQDGFNPQGWSTGLNAEAYMSHFTQWARDYPEVEWWELWNEQDPPGTSGHVGLARLTVECMQIAESEGYKLALASYSSGVPENDDWQAIWDQTAFFQQARAGGHILSLHAYCRTSNESATQAHLLRPKWLYENILIPNNCVVPFVFTELSVDESGANVGISDWATDALMAEYRRMDDLLAGLWYCLGGTIYTFGALAHYNHDKLWRPVADLILSLKDRQNALPPTEDLPDDGYDRYVLVVDYDRIKDQTVRNALYLEGAARGIYTGPSHDEAANRPKGARTSTVELPGFSEADAAYVAFYKERDPHVQLVFRPPPGQEPGPPDVPPSGSDELWLSPPTTHVPHVVTSPYGENRGTVIHTGLDLRSSWRVWGDELLAAVDGEVILVGYETGREYFGYQVQLKATVGNDTVVVRYAHLVEGGAYVQKGQRVTRGQKLGQPDNTGQSTADHLHLDVRVNGKYVDPTPLIRWDHTPQPTRLMLGVNDPDNQGAAAWMLAEQSPGLVVLPIFVDSSNAVPLHFQAAAAAGVRVIVNLRYSYARDNGGGGTLPHPATTAWPTFIETAAQTIQQSEGVWGWEISNEANNPREHPIGRPLTAIDVAAAYNAIRERVPGARLSPGALDPFNAQCGDPRDWLAGIYGAIAGAEFVCAHGYIRGPDPALCTSDAKFADWPLTWQSLNYPGCVTQLLSYLPAAYRSLPVYVTEFNHLWKTVEPDWGWVDDARAGDVVRAAVAAGQAAGLAGLALYRWDGDAWAFRTNTAVMNTLRSLLRGS